MSNKVTTKTANQRWGIGVDESNHGALPEIYVAVLSSTKEDFIKHSSRLPKKRKNVNLEKFLEDIEDFRFVVLEGKHIAKIGTNAIKIPSIGLLVNSFYDQIYLPDTRLIIDGKVGMPEGHEDIRQIISGHYNCRLRKDQLIFRVDADRDYRVVNNADIIAYQLRKIYERLKTPSRGPYSQHRIPFEEIIPL